MWYTDELEAGLLGIKVRRSREHGSELTECLSNAHSVTAFHRRDNYAAEHELC